MTDAKPHISGLPVLRSLRRVGRLTWVEIRKLVSHKLFPVTAAVTLLVTAGLGFAAKSFTEGMESGVRFSNYSLWVVSSGIGLRIGTLLLVALGAMAMSTEATGRTLNTMLTRPIRRIEFVLAKVLSLVFATAVVVLAAALASYIVGGTVQERSPRVTWNADRPEASWKFPSYSDLIDPEYPDLLIASRAKIMGNILFGFALLVVPVLAAVSVGFLLGTLIDSTGLAIGLSVGAFVTLEATKVIPMFEEHLGRLAFNYPITRISTLMLEAGNGTVPQWHDAIVGVGVSAIYVAVCLVISVLVFCRRDITL